MMTKTMFSSLQIKSFNEEEGIIRGIATTPTTDKVGDIVEPMGAQFTLPLPLHMEHDRKDVVGEVFEARATPEGIEFAARVAKDVSDQIAEVWRRVKGGLIRFVSVGFRVQEYERIESGLRFTKWAWDELSLTTIPANPQAAILAVKNVSPTSIKESQKMTIAEQIQSFQAKRAEAVAKMDALVLKGITLQGEDEANYAAAEAEVAQIDKHLARLQDAEARQAKAAKPVQGVPFVSVESNAPKGIDFVRMTKAIALAKGNMYHAADIAKSMNYGNRVEHAIKAAVAAGTTAGASGYGALVEPATLASEFIELLQPATIVGRLPSLRRTPMDVRLPRQTGATTTTWVGVAKAAPLTNAAFTDMTVGRHKVAAIVALSCELLQRSDPNAELLIRSDLIGAASRAVDLAFIDSTNAGIAGVKPASVLNGTTNTAAASGTTAAAVRVDVAKLFGFALAANQPLDGAAFVMHPATALQLSMMRHATSGQAEFPGITMDGGVFFGLPVIVSSHVPGSAIQGYPLALVVQPEILLAEEGINVEASTEASLEFDDTPTSEGTTPTGAELVSLWQNGLTAVKLVRPITWALRRPSAVGVITATKYAA